MATAGATDLNGLTDGLMLLVKGALVRSHNLRDPTVVYHAKLVAAKLVNHALAG